MEEVYRRKQTRERDIMTLIKISGGVGWFVNTQNAQSAE